MSSASRCPLCNSPQPHLHPAVQFEGETHPCSHPYHRTITPSNTPQRISETDQLLARIYCGGQSKLVA